MDLQNAIKLYIVNKNGYNNKNIILRGKKRVSKYQTMNTNYSNNNSEICYIIFI